MWLGTALPRSAGALTGLWRPSGPRCGESLKRLARDRRKAVKLGVAGNPCAPGEVLVRLSKLKSAEIAEAALETLATLERKAG